ncbi:MAG: hypothetical protein KGH98_03955, partial [Candidatus Micrarchaeota archaeon]|nr:hypothetical protein [Candidatus Micrarchaeota archaeon]
MPAEAITSQVRVVLAENVTLPEKVPHEGFAGIVVVVVEVLVVVEVDVLVDVDVEVLVEVDVEVEVLV